MGKFRAPASAPAPGKTRLRSAPSPGSSSSSGSLLIRHYDEITQGRGSMCPTARGTRGKRDASWAKKLK